jgi:nitrogen regulatory protein PII 2
MKEIIAIIRPNKVTATRKALDNLGLPGMTVIPVYGRGKQKGIQDEVSVDIDPAVRGKAQFLGMRYVPKRLLSVVVPAAKADRAIGIIVKVNQSGHVGDGKIIVRSIGDAMRVRDGERGVRAIN